MKQMWIIPAWLLVALSGCIPSYPLQEGQIDSYWSLDADVSNQAEAYQPSIGQTKLPARWIVHQRPSVILSTVSIVRASDQIQEGAEVVEFAVSPIHTQSIVDILQETRAAMVNLRTISTSPAKADRRQWAQTMAETLAQIEHVTRLSSLEDADNYGDESIDPTGLPAKPMLEMVAMYLNERAGGNLLRDLDPEEVDQLRSVLAELTLRLGFAVAGKTMPEGMRRQTTALMKATPQRAALEKQLHQMLLAKVDQASPAAEGGALESTVQTAVTWAPKFLEFLEGFIRQWDRMERAELQLIRHGQQAAVVATIKVQPGKEIRLDKVMFMQPTLVFKGTSKIVVLPDMPQSAETVILFEGQDGGAVELRFEGILYGLARLFAFPLADGALREIRVLTKTAQQGRQMVNVSVLMEARDDRRHPRRILVFHDVQEKKVVRQAFSLQSTAVKRTTAVSYITPKRRYTFHRSKGL